LSVQGPAEARTRISEPPCFVRWDLVYQTFAEVKIEVSIDLQFDDRVVDLVAVAIDVAMRITRLIASAVLEG
jgi:hypothetical protein